MSSVFVATGFFDSAVTAVCEVMVIGVSLVAPKVFVFAVVGFMVVLAHFVADWFGCLGVVGVIGVFALMFVAVSDVFNCVRNSFVGWLCVVRVGFAVGWEVIGVG